jgi:hypothetical protein
LLIKYIKSVLWRVVKRLSYIEEARCLKVKSNFKALFSSRNRQRALSDAILLLAGPCHVGHKNANRLHAHGSACTLVAVTQDVA